MVGVPLGYRGTLASLGSVPEFGTARPSTAPAGPRPPPPVGQRGPQEAGWPAGAGGGSSPRLPAPPAPEPASEAAVKARAVVAKAQDALARATAAALAGAEGGGGGGEGGGGELSQAEAGRPHISSPELEREIEVEEAEEAVEAAEAAQEEAEHGGRAPQRLRRQFLNRAVWLQYRPQGNELVHIIPPEGRWPQENELVHIIPPEGRWPQGNELVHIIPLGGRWREDWADGVWKCREDWAGGV